MTVKMRGLENFDKLPKVMQKQLSRAVNLSGLKIQKEAQREFLPLSSVGTTRSGKKKYPRPTPHPGHPHVRTGFLRGKIFKVMVGKLSVIVGTNVKYGGMLEVGTTQMKARPFLLPGLLKSKQFITNTFKKFGLKAVVSVRLR